MFNQQQQQFHQLIQLQHLLQQQHQHTVQPAAHHPSTPQHALSAQHAAPRAIPNPVQHQQQQQVLNLRPASPARLLNTHPVIQRALLMQQMQAGNLRGLSMVAPPMPPFFPATARHSILGIPPIGVTVKGPSVAFPPLPFQQHRVYHKEHYKGHETKRDTSTEKANAEVPRTASEADDITTSEDTENLTECSITDPLEPSAKRARSSDAGKDGFSAEGTAEGSVAEERSVESQSPEGVSGGRALKVTIQLCSESRTTALQPTCPDKNSSTGSSVHSRARFCCYVCKTGYHTLQNFQAHLVTAQHQHKIQEIEHLSNACLVTLLPTAKDSQATVSSRDGKKKQMRWCNVCQVHFSCDLIKHRRTQEHKMAKRSLRPFCTVCSRHFKTPRKFVEHMKSPEHKQKSQEIKQNEKEPWNMEESEELITVDAVGCFEEEDEDDEEEEEEGVSADDTSEDKESFMVHGEDIQANLEEGEEYNPETTYGLDYLVPVAGYLCRLCHKFYPSDSAARLTHCKSLVHFQNIQRYKATKNRVTSQARVSSLNSEVEKAKTAEDATQGAEGLVPLTDEHSVSSTKQASHSIIGVEVASSASEETDSGPACDTAMGSSEEDSGYFMDPAMLLVKGDQGSEAGNAVIEEEVPCGSGAPSTRRSSARQKHR